MIAVLYLIICMFWGVSLIKLLVPNIPRLFTACSPTKRITANVPDILFEIPAGILTGLVVITPTQYYITSAMSRLLNDGNQCKKLSVALVMALFVIFGVTNLTLAMKRESDEENANLLKGIPPFGNYVGNMTYYGMCTILLTVVSTFLMFYSYRISGTELWAGWSTCSDMAPHTAMVSSFGVGFNYPSQYMHFAGDGINYHFFFYYLCGTLQYLGLPIDFAINIPSILTMVCCLELLGLIGVLLFKRRAAFILAPILVLFRSSFDFFYQLSDYMKIYNMSLSDALRTMRTSVSWFDTTPYDNWGIWAINVYPNQRHLMLGTGIMMIMIILCLPFLRRMTISLSRNGIKAFFISREAWLARKSDPIHPVGITVLSCILVSCMPYFHGSALIGSLLVLALMAVFSETRLTHVCIAVCAVISSFIQTQLFSYGAGNVISFQYVSGFVAEDKSFSGSLKYLLIVTGLTLIIAGAYAIFLLVRDILKKQPVYRSLFFLCCLVPLVFAFNFRISKEILANHKFIQFTITLADVFTAGALSELISLPSIVRKKLPKAGFAAVQTATILIALAAMVPLTATGICEWCTYINLNKYHVSVNTESELTEWISANTEPSDVFLTPAWSLNRFFLAGRPAYYGHPYYAWSAGHDTYTRLAVFEWLISGANNDIDAFVNYCRQRNIKYLVDDPEFYEFNYSPGISYNHDFFAENLKLVAYFQSEGTSVYQIFE